MNKDRFQKNLTEVQQDLEIPESRPLNQISSFLSELEDCDTEAARIEILHDRLAIKEKIISQMIRTGSFLQIQSLLERSSELSTIIDRCKKAIATNPNSPPDLLLKLSGEYLLDIKKNPAYELILLEKPEFIAFDPH